MGVRFELTNRAVWVGAIVPAVQSAIDAILFVLFTRKNTKSYYLA